jgi:nitrite reductase/ring-hydroxylating ferredoxin subunit
MARRDGHQGLQGGQHAARGLRRPRRCSCTAPATEWRVYDSRCPHQTTNIPHLALKDCTLTCPKHEWQFDIRSGDCTAKGNSPLKQWPSKVVKGRLLACW